MTIERASRVSDWSMVAPVWADVIIKASGAIDLFATGDVGLASVTSVDGDVRVLAGDGDAVVGTIVDGTSSESALVATGGVLTLEAETGIGAPGAGDLDVAVHALSAANRTDGSIVVSSAQDLTISSAGVQALAGEGHVLLTLTGGSLVTIGDLVAAGSGSLEVVVAAGDLTMEETSAFVAPMGDVFLSAAGNAVLTRVDAIASTVTVYNAVMDALRPLGVTSIDMPLTPERVWRAIQQAKGN